MDSSVSVISRFARALFCGGLFLAGMSDASAQAPVLASPGAAVLSAPDQALLEEMEQTAWRFFVEQADPHTGLVRDRARADGSPSPGKASIASSGFALSAWAVATERGWTERPVALGRCRALLHFLATQAPREHGFFYHFMEMETGARAWQCELSTIDTGLFLAGAIMAREYFQDPEITALVNQLYREIDWAWFLNGGETFAMGWHPETGFSRFRWNKYSELMMLTLLGLGAEHHPIDPALWHAWQRRPDDTYAGFNFIQGPPLFVHQFTHAYVDFRGLRDAHADYFHNSVLATLAQRQFFLDLKSEFPQWGEQLWGLTSSDSATGYKAWGGPPRTMHYNALDGTVVPCAPAGSLPFAPRETMAVLRNLRTSYSDRVWSRYGFIDAFNPHNTWNNPDVIGIDLGISLLQAENARTGFVWRVFGQAPEIQRALDRAGFVPTGRTLPPAQHQAIQSLATQAWQRTASAPVAPASAGVQISAVVAAHSLGLITAADAIARATGLLQKCAVPTDAAALGEYAAGLVTLRQALPALAAEATRRLAALDWAKAPLTATQLGSRERLAVFFQVASHARPPSAWSDLARVPEKIRSVHVLAPAEARDQLRPGLWLDENDIITGASAAQFAYAQALQPSPTGAPYAFDASTTALLIEHFPTIAATALLAAPPSAHWLADAPLADASALLVSAANCLAAGAVRHYFQADPLVQTGRAALPEFAAAAFGPNTATFGRFELGGPLRVPPAREITALAATTPRDQWQWAEISGDEFRESAADVRPGDPALSLRFAFTWDQDALTLHAEAVDDLPLRGTPSNRNGVELFLNPKNDGLAWGSADNYQFGFKLDGTATEWFHHRPAQVAFHATPRGYTIEARIAWADLGVTPRAGLELGVSPAIVAEGSKEWEPSVKLNWRYYRRADERYGLGTLRLR